MSYKTELGEAEITELQNSINSSLADNDYYGYEAGGDAVHSDEEQNKPFLMWVLHNQYSNLFRPSFSRHSSYEEVTILHNDDCVGPDGAFIYGNMDEYVIYIFFTKHGTPELSPRVVKSMDTLLFNLEYSYTNRLDQALVRLIDEACDLIGDDGYTRLCFNLVLVTSEVIDSECDAKLNKLQDKIETINQNNSSSSYFCLDIIGPDDLFESMMIKNI